MLNKKYNNNSITQNWNWSYKVFNLNYTQTFLNNFIKSLYSSLALRFRNFQIKHPLQTLKNIRNVNSTF